MGAVEADPTYSQHTPRHGWLSSIKVKRKKRKKPLFWSLIRLFFRAQIP